MNSYNYFNQTMCAKVTVVKKVSGNLVIQNMFPQVLGPTQTQGTAQAVPEALGLAQTQSQTLTWSVTQS